jgi:hypothetical protein
MKVSHLQKSLLAASLLVPLFLLVVFVQISTGWSQVRPVPSPLITRTPPDASKISFGAPNGLGEAIVTGAPGAVLPSTHVLLINQNTTHQDYVTSAADGSFTAQVFAPPGSFIMVKHGPDHVIWDGTASGANQPGLPVFPSTTIYRPHEHSAATGALPFADAGAININTEGLTTTIDAAWSITGTVTPITGLEPGGTITVEATILLYSQAITSGTDLSGVNLQMGGERPWLMLFDEEGNPVPALNQGASARLTASGFPIQDRMRPEIWSTQSWDPVSWQYKDGNRAEGQLILTMELDASMPAGTYRPVLGIEFTGVPAGTGWRAAILSSFAMVPPFTYGDPEVPLPPLEVGASTSTAQNAAGAGDNRLIWYLLMDHASLGTRGTGAVQDSQIYQPSTFVVAQGAPYVLQPNDPYTGELMEFRMEPYLPMLAHGRGATPNMPLLPLNLPGGQICVVIHEPDGVENDLGCDSFDQSISGEESTRTGFPLNLGTIEISEYYGLTTNQSDYQVEFEKYGPHTIEMTGWVQDVWGNTYEGGGTYQIWVAEPIDMDPGFLPGTPMTISDTLNTAVQLNPRLPAFVNFTVWHYPDSDPLQEQVHTAAGWANRFGYFSPGTSPIVLNEPGEYRVDLTAEYWDPETGDFYVGAQTWGGVVMTPPAEATLIARGRRGSDNLLTIPGSWFVLCDLNPPADSTPHILSPYLRGDLVWSRADPSDGGDCLGDALILGASIQDPIGTIEAAIEERFDRYMFLSLLKPGTFAERVVADELPLFSSTSSGAPVTLFPEQADQIAYAYLYSERPGLRVRETIAEDGQNSGYWRFESMYENQPGVGYQGDLPNDFKFHYIGVVYRDLETGLNEYLGQGNGWIHLPLTDTVGSRVMPPFSGPGNGGWPTTGGPLMHLQGQAVHMFIMPTGVRPGAVLQVGERFDFGGHLLPALDSMVSYEVTAPGGQKTFYASRANPVGYYYDPNGSFTLDEPGRWTVAVTVWHDGKIGSGASVNCDPQDPFDELLPCPSGDVLGSANGVYAFYVVPAESERLAVSTPVSGPLDFVGSVDPITISGPLPGGVSSPVVHYTISMPGFILQEGTAQIGGGQYSFTFDPATLNADFPNLDLIGRHGNLAGLSDTFSIGLLLTGTLSGEPVYQATTLTIQGDIVYVENGLNPEGPQLFLPVVTRP